MLRRALRWPHGFIAVFVLVQLLLPLHYYVARRDAHDERFAWRMFSPMRMTTCELAMSRDDKPIKLSTEFHMYWVRAAERGRFVVVESMAAHMWRKRPGSKVTAYLTCTYLDGE